MRKLQLLISLTALLLIMAGCRTNGTFQEVYGGKALQQPIDSSILANSIRQTMTHYDWTIEEYAVGKILARKGSIEHNVMLFVEVQYDNAGYSIHYLDDSGYEVDRSSSTAHVNYDVWMKRLNEMIFEKYNEMRDEPGNISVIDDTGIINMTDHGYKIGLEQTTWLGFDWYENRSGEIFVTNVSPESSVFGKVSKGDKILEIQNIKVSSSKEIYEILLDMYPGQEVELVLLRSGLSEHIQYNTDAKEVVNYLNRLVESVVSDSDVRVAVLVTSEYDGSLTDSNGDISGNIINRLERDLQTEVENVLLVQMRSFDSFVLIDRTRVTQILNEHDFTLNGLTDENVRLGKLIGATHILDISQSVYKDDTLDSGYSRSVSERLIDVETGEVVSSALR